MTAGRERLSFMTSEDFSGTAERDSITRALLVASEHEACVEVC